MHISVSQHTSRLPLDTTKYCLHNNNLLDSIMNVIIVKLCIQRVKKEDGGSISEMNNLDGYLSWCWGHDLGVRSSSCSFGQVARIHNSAAFNLLQAGQIRHNMVTVCTTCMHSHSEPEHLYRGMGGMGHVCGIPLPSPNIWYSPNQLAHRWAGLMLALLSLTGQLLSLDKPFIKCSGTSTDLQTACDQVDWLPHKTRLEAVSPTNNLSCWPNSNLQPPPWACYWPLCPKGIKVTILLWNTSLLLPPCPQGIFLGTLINHITHRNITGCADDVRWFT